MGLKFSVFIATSLDGFIARKDGALDWLPGSDGGGAEAGQEDYGYKAFYDSVDALVMGRNTYQTVLSFANWPYPGKKVIVLSSSYPRMPLMLATDVEATSCSPEELAKYLSGRGASHVYVDGGKTIQSFLRAGLLQEITITRIPVLIGEGIPLFGPLERDIILEHLKSKSFANGFVQSKYKVVGTGTPQ